MIFTQLFFCALWRTYVQNKINRINSRQKVNLFPLVDTKTSQSIFHLFCCSLAQLCLILCDPMNCSPPVEFSKQKYWSGLPFPTSGTLPYPRMEPGYPVSPTLVGGFFTTTATWEAPNRARATLKTDSLGLNNGKNLQGIYESGRYIHFEVFPDHRLSSCPVSFLP